MLWSHQKQNVWDVNNKYKAELGGSSSVVDEENDNVFYGTQQKKAGSSAPWSPFYMIGAFHCLILNYSTLPVFAFSLADFVATIMAANLNE